MSHKVIYTQRKIKQKKKSEQNKSVLWVVFVCQSNNKMTKNIFEKCFYFQKKKCFQKKKQKRRLFFWVCVCDCWFQKKKSKKKAKKFGVCELFGIVVLTLQNVVLAFVCVFMCWLCVCTVFFLYVLHVLC